MRLAIFGKYFKDDRFNEIQLFFNALISRKIPFSIYRKYYDDCLRNGLHLPNNLTTFNDSKDFDPTIFDVLVSIGGDGTILSSLEILREAPVPVVGVNTGRLGFLAGVAATDSVAMLDELEKGHFSLDKRTLLELSSDKQMFGGVKFALNDFVIHKKDSSSMITIHTYINGEFLNSYWSDGLIISTPTGSTGYNLSCGGPILYPASQSFVITPIAPHNLNVRPIIISDQNVISFEVEGRSRSFLATLDSRSESIDNGTQLAIKKADFCLNLLRLNDENYLQTLREKLMWGYDNRNFRK
ncbi:MAG: NAD kinase [Bacteroidia bacterium]|nr:NAD kinase [Bacteroidia bacterium]MCF8426785.1 NAD kinase [Bacteroidia bacterium]MCF8445577.1 NAD kinase [Bacteroidia bacterium]